MTRLNVVDGKAVGGELGGAAAILTKLLGSLRDLSPETGRQTFRLRRH